ncbi:response regulator [Natronoglycomyces albus]|uniref:Response regulator transcription factor n=1 Tax=Natronoglycomyces albus TaxID=2811108 RepID=A0A895XUA6_9ACTN|nr:response regulator transcription factor [Natronoglycomyces albus]QSB05238.1 response regulator transcription factor [Natronoglycomyces albus]
MTIRLLLADDQKVVRAGFRALLEDEPGLEIVAEARDGLEAVELATKYQASIVLMDVRMPRLDGIEATRRLTKAGTDSPDVIVVTTFDDDEYVYGALRSGAAGFLLKDTPAETLVNAIRAVDAGHGLIMPQVTRRVISRFAALSPDPGRTGDLDALTPRERDVLVQVARGGSNAEIARALFVEEATVKSHVSSILLKLGLQSRVQAVICAYETGLVTAGGR